MSETISESLKAKIFEQERIFVGKKDECKPILDCLSTELGIDVPDLAGMSEPVETAGKIWVPIKSIDAATWLLRYGGIALVGQDVSEELRLAIPEPKTYGLAIENFGEQMGKYGRGRVVLAVREDIESRFCELNSFNVATSYPNIAKNYALEHDDRMQVDMKLEGSVEIAASLWRGWYPPPVEGVVEFADSGSSLRSRGLVERVNILPKVRCSAVWASPIWD